MCRLIETFGPDEDPVIREYATAELRGEVEIHKDTGIAPLWLPDCSSVG
jgi:hypothetical protein